MAPHRDPSPEALNGSEWSQMSVTPDTSIPSSPRDAASAAAAAEPIAIVGMACRLPGDIRSTSQLWDMLANGRSGQGKVPSSRFNVDAFYHPDGVNRPGSMNTMGGYFLSDDIRDFDPEFFQISPMEATYMDPQQRRLLETVFECFESAGVSLEQASGSSTGVYVGNFTVDFQVMQTRDPEYLQRYSATGMGTTILSNRISHVFDLKGPSFVLDTACSSSLYCLHAAATALKSRECDAAIVAGANLVQSAEQHLGTMKAGVLSSTSTCHTFDSSADGYGRADGIGALYVKRLSDAIRDNDPIRAVIRATAVNANGRTPGITLPSATGQEAVIRKAYQTAGLRTEDTAYVEAHGTGTPVGDPIEAEAIGRVFGKPHQTPIKIGSVKTNLGHSEAASGISGVIKTVLAIENRLIPPTIGIQTINPKIKTAEWNVEVVTQATPWNQELRRAGINSFGYGGANAHVIVDNVEAHLERPFPELALRKDGRQLFLVPVSAASPASLERRIEDLAASPAVASANIFDLAYTLAHRRTHFAERGFVIANRNEPQSAFSMEKLKRLPTPPSQSPSNYAFVFTGQGAQWPGMCAELFDQYSIFRDCITLMDTVLQSLPDRPNWTLREALLEGPETSMINDVTRSQPCCTAIQIGLVWLLASWGITPTAVVGHSSGEIAAAFAAGHLSAAEAIISAYYRGFVVGKHQISGAMMAVGLSREAGNEAIEKVGLVGQIRVACVNSPESITISGDAQAIDTMLTHLQQDAVFARKLQTGGRAYHSHHMQQFGDEYERLLREATRHATPSISMRTDAQFFSSVTAQPKNSGFDAAYWRSNLENPVQFSDAVHVMSQSGEFHLIEVGPHSALEMPLKQIRKHHKIADDAMPYSTAITRGKNSVESVLSLAGNLFLHGRHISFGLVNGMNNLKKGLKQYRALPDLPPYPWTYEQTLWKESRSSLEFRQRKYPRHELLGSLVPGGDTIHRTWRNVLKVDDVSWLADHKLQETVVFPGAGYLAMAVEAAMQATDTMNSDDLSFRFRRVNIMSALALSTEPTAEVELYTSLKEASLSGTSTSRDWWEFSITSYKDSIATTHSTGMISVSAATPFRSKCAVTEGTLEPTAARTWYDKLIKSGLNFGNAFQSINEFLVPRMRTERSCSTKARFIQEWSPNQSYPIHPITIDAMLQTSIVATTAGVVRDLSAKVPTYVDSAVLRKPIQSTEQRCAINSTAQPVGFGAAIIDAELTDSQGQILVQLNNVRLAPYNGAGQSDSGKRRHPALRSLWKPDPFGLGPMPTESFTNYLNAFVAEAHSEVSDEGLLKLGATINLLSHKNPRLRILELGNDIPEISLAALALLHAGTDFERYASYTRASIDEDGLLYGAPVDAESGKLSCGDKVPQIAEPDFDLVLLPRIDTATSYLDKQINTVIGTLSEAGIVLAVSPEKEWKCEQLAVLTSALTNGSGSVILAQSPPKNGLEAVVGNKDVVVVHRNESALSNALIQKLEASIGRTISSVALANVSSETVRPGSVVFSLLESEEALLATVNDEDMDRVKTITNNASSLVWVTGGDLLRGQRPDFALAFGLSRALMLEQPSLRFVVFDLDDASSDVDRTASHLIASLKQKRDTDFEFVQKGGVVHVSRFVPDDSLNDAFRTSQGAVKVEMPAAAAKRVQLQIESPGQFDTLYWKQIEVPETLAPSDVQVNVKALGLNAKDFYAFGGKVDTKDGTSSLEFCGVVDRVGAAVSSVRPGDRVVVMAPSYFRTTEIVPAFACQRLSDSEDFPTMSTLSVVYATALYALHDRAHIQAGESVLIHSGAGGVGIAAIQVAQLAGAKVYTTVSNEAKKKYLIETFGLEESCIFSSRDTSFLPALLKATGGRGVDVVLNSLTGELLHASWRACAPFGRFIEIGKRDLVDGGKLEMEQFLKNVTFSAFDMSNLYYSENEAHQRTWARLMGQVLDLYRSGKIQKIEPLEVFDMSDITRAMRHFSSRNRMGKVAIGFENPESVLSVQPIKYKTTFSRDKWYIMVGCLGGLGRSMSKWMMARGARKFVYLGRSGTDKPAARRLLEDLEQSGAECKVVRGDVCNLADVEEVVRQIDSVGGVCQFAMGLNESLFTVMSNHYWHTGIDPKVVGTWNLHNAIQGKDQDLEFFLMSSSVSGSVGTATESNYCSANYFLDVFARYRQSLGLPATSVGLGMISEVGYLHENPEIEALLLRKGIQAINEDELLQLIDLSLSQQSFIPHAYDDGARTHILTGLEPLGLQELRKKGFEGSNPTLNDPRASVLAHALDSEADMGLKGSDSRLPGPVAKDVADGKSLPDAVLDHICKRFSNLVLVALAKIDPRKPLAQYGMDSMLTAELRTWFFQAFEVDIPFLELMNKTVTIESLNKTVVEWVEAGAA